MEIEAAGRSEIQQAPTQSKAARIIEQIARLGESRKAVGLRQSVAGWGLLEIVKRAPISCGQRSEDIFPWPGGGSVILFFFATPKDIAGTEIPGRHAPVRFSEHKISKLLIRFRIFSETLGPEMARVPEHDIAPLQKKRVIVSGISGEPGIKRQVLNRQSDAIDFCAAGKSEAGAADGEPAEKANEPRREQENAKSKAG